MFKIIKNPTFTWTHNKGHINTNSCQYLLSMYSVPILFYTFYTYELIYLSQP